MAAKRLAAKMQASLRSQACKQARARTALESASDAFRDALEAHQVACHEEAKARDAAYAASRAKSQAEFALSEARLVVLRAAAGEQ